MDAVEFLKQFSRMCKAYSDDGGCKECPAYEYRCGEEFYGQEEDGVHLVEQWATKHQCKAGDIVKAVLEDKPKWRKVDDKFVKTSEMETQIKCYKVIEQ